MENVLQAIDVVKRRRSRNGIFLFLSPFTFTKIRLTRFNSCFRSDDPAVCSRYRREHQRCSCMGCDWPGRVSTIRVFEIGAFGLLRPFTQQAPQRNL